MIAQDLFDVPCSIFRKYKARSFGAGIVVCGGKMYFALPGCPARNFIGSVILGNRPLTQPYALPLTRFA